MQPRIPSVAPAASQPRSLRDSRRRASSGRCCCRPRRETRPPAPELTRSPAGRAEAEMAELYVRPGEPTLLAGVPARGSRWAPRRVRALPTDSPGPPSRCPPFLSLPSPPQATRSAAGTTRPSSPTGCRPRPAGPSARPSPRESPLRRMDPPEVRGSRQGQRSFLLT